MLRCVSWHWTVLQICRNEDRLPYSHWLPSQAINVGQTDHTTGVSAGLTERRSLIPIKAWRMLSGDLSKDGTGALLLTILDTSMESLDDSQISRWSLEVWPQSKRLKRFTTVLAEAYQDNLNTQFSPSCGHPGGCGRPLCGGPAARGAGGRSQLRRRAVAAPQAARLRSVERAC